ncbi:sugar kinase [uncultured Jatrophihabitans sp.]|uniref:sugar kinase n=1 Tax=uncultured Jatrophihabitans sp. TaxID=1610747 RepID=UPI0035C9EC5B
MSEHDAAPDAVAPRGLVTIGESLALFAAPTVGRLAHQSHLELRMGGAESNVAIAVSRLGGAATWIGRVGDDPLGEFVVATIRGEGVRVHAPLDSASTSVMIRERRNSWTSRVTYYRENGPGAHLRPADIPEACVRNAAIVHLTGITAALSASSLATVHSVIDIADEAGVKVSFDVNYRRALWSPDRAAPALTAIARRCSILFAGTDEVHLLGYPDAHTNDLCTTARALAALGPAEIVIKAGELGAASWDGADALFSPAMPVVSIDPVGAGDAFAGGYLAELLTGAGLAGRLTTATRCGALVVAAAGDWEAAPTRADLRLLEKAPGLIQR